MSDERLARQWAERVAAREWNTAEKQAAAEHILATTTPTMDDIEWNDAEHMFAGATMMYVTGPTEVVMLSERDDASINFALLDGRVGDQFKERLTPNGKKYELREVTDRHPETLRTLEDYENAPVGTVVAAPSDTCLIKFDEGWYTPRMRTRENPIDFGKMAVLRWGWGE